LGALRASDAAEAFYAARDWKLWQGSSFALTPAGITRTLAKDGCIYVLPMEVSLDLSSELVCDWRDGDLW
jgi:aminoglycoside 2'-N-acetyltransferase I